jgi:hypothetical protein
MTTLDDGDEDQVRILVLDAATGATESDIVIAGGGRQWTLIDTLSTDRYAVLLPDIVPSVEDTPIPLRVVELHEEREVEVDLQLEPLAP